VLPSSALFTVASFPLVHTFIPSCRNPNFCQNVISFYQKIWDKHEL
jgi:hypothetical protein